MVDKSLAVKGEVVEAKKAPGLREKIMVFSPGRQLFLLGLHRGLTAGACRKIARRYGFDVEAESLLDPGWQFLMEEVGSNCYGVDEVQQLWSEIRSRHFIDMLMDDAERQLGESDPKERDKIVIAKAAEYSIKVLNKEVVKGDVGEAPPGDYDELVLKKHRKV